MPGNMARSSSSQRDLEQVNDRGVSSSAGSNNNIQVSSTHPQSQTVGKGAKKKGKFKRSDGSFSDTSSNSLLRQVRRVLVYSLSFCYWHTIGLPL